jgi:uncharacterized membrane protein (TIGR02234 family)
MPVVTALSLVVLAIWGVLLVTRRGVRRGLAWFLLLMSGGLFAIVMLSYWTIPATIRADFRVAGFVPPPVDHTGWFWTAAAGAGVCLITALLAVRDIRGWPEMSSRYDAPGSQASAQQLNEPESNIDLWKALDNGHDPTV